jgi:hypothetical protein
VITIFGALTPIVMANKLEMEGLTERINIFTLQGYIFVLSLCLFLNRNKAQVNEQILWKNIAEGCALLGKICYCYMLKQFSL